MRIALQDPEWGRMTPKAIADLCNVSNHLVDDMIQELGLSRGNIGADGKRYPTAKEDKNIQNQSKGRKPQQYKRLESHSESKRDTLEFSNVMQIDTDERWLKKQEELLSLARHKGRFQVVFLDLTRLPAERDESLAFLSRLSHQEVFAEGAVLYAMADAGALPDVFGVFSSWGFLYHPSFVAWSQPHEAARSAVVQRMLLVGTRGGSMAPGLYAKPFMQPLASDVGSLLSVLGENFAEWERRLVLYGPLVDGWSSWG